MKGVETMAVSEAAKRASAKYERENIRRYALKINLRHESELADWVDSHENIQSYLINLVRADYERNHQTAGEENSTMEIREIITADSFGSDCPTNWEEIAAALNQIIADRGIADDDDAIDSLWEDYWNGDLPGVPKAVED